VEINVWHGDVEEESHSWIEFYEEDGEWHVMELLPASAGRVEEDGGGWEMGVGSMSVVVLLVGESGAQSVLCGAIRSSGSKWKVVPNELKRAS